MLTVLSLVLVHVFASNLATLAAWELLGLGLHVVTVRSMLVETAVAATGALPAFPPTLHGKRIWRHPVMMVQKLLGAMQARPS